MQNLQTRPKGDAYILRGATAVRTEDNSVPLTTIIATYKIKALDLYRVFGFPTWELGPEYGGIKWIYALTVYDDHKICLTDLQPKRSFDKINRWSLSSQEGNKDVIFPLELFLEQNGIVFLRSE
ncbi:MAG: hypothetical protein KDH96_01900 [Candidatus Riesia sp.]|nr:hypothetical protein [Candidatus Riesia sp.]